MLGDADRVAVGDLGDRDPALDRGLQVDMVRADPGGDAILRFFALAIRSAVMIGGPERLRDHHVGVDELALELASPGRPCRT